MGLAELSIEKNKRMEPIKDLASPSIEVQSQSKSDLIKQCFGVKSVVWWTVHYV